MPLGVSLTLVSAPAGFGKTTLVAQWLQNSGRSFAWLSLDKEDNEAPRFWSYFIAALQTMDEALGKAVLSIVGSSSSFTNFNTLAPDISSKDWAKGMLTGLINEIAATGRELVLTLDDYQYIDTQVIHEGITFLIEHCPSNLHLVILTRQDPLLPLARLRVRNQLTEIRSSNLRFTREEMDQFLQETIARPIKTDELNEIEKITEGWVAGVWMVSLSLKSQGDPFCFIHRVSNDQRQVLEYLLEEVLRWETPQNQAFLLQNIHPRTDEWIIVRCNYQ